MTAYQGITMDEIKQNGVVHWKGFLITLTTVASSLLITIAGFIFAMYLHIDSKMVTKDQFKEFKEHIMVHLEDIKQEIRKKD